MVLGIVQGRKASLEIDAQRSASEEINVLAIDDKHPKPFQAFRISSGAVVNNVIFQAIILACIAANSIMIGISTYEFIEDNPSYTQVFASFDRVFLVIYTIELSLQFGYRGYTIFMDGWLIFDLVVVGLSWAFESFQFSPVLRTFRSLRLVSGFKNLQLLAMTLVDASPKLSSIGVLLCLMFYIFSVMFTMLYGNIYEEGLTEYDNFSRLDKSFFTLFQMTTLDSWGMIMNETKDLFPEYYWIPFVVVVNVLHFFVLNMMISVICDGVIGLRRERGKERKQREAMDDTFYVAKDVHDEMLNSLARLSLDLSYLQENHAKMQVTIHCLNNLISRYD